MSRIKTEIDRAIEHYGDRATVFRVVRMAFRGWEKMGSYNDMVRHIKHEAIQASFIMRWILSRRKKYIHHIRRLLTIDRPVTTERLKQAIGNEIKEYGFVCFDECSHFTEDQTRYLFSRIQNKSENI